jgi:hypothetical protein
MDDRNFRVRHFYPALRRARLRLIRVHDLRHTAASMLIAAGADLPNVSRQLGHGNANITLSVCTHWFVRRIRLGREARRVSHKGDWSRFGPVRQGKRDKSAGLILMVARGGIEPPTRGFLVRLNLHPASPKSIQYNA